MENPNVLIVEDEIIVAKDIEQTLLDNGFLVTGMAKTVEKAMKLFSEGETDLIICDINLEPEMNGIDFISRIKKVKPVRVIYLTAYSDEKTINKALETQPDSYITKPFTHEQLLVAVKLVMNGNMPDEAPSSDYPQPTKRELDIIECIARGLTSHEIADKLGISFETVQTHRKKILHKYKINSSSELITLALKNHWIKS